MRFEGKSVLVTGGGSGIGRAAVEAFAAEGAKVLCLDRDIDKAEAVAVGLGKQVRALQCDVTREAELAAAVAHCLAVFGRLDIAVNSAGIVQQPVSFEESDAETFNRVFAVNAFGVWAAMRHELPPMLKQGDGAIVNVASSTGLVGGAFMQAYCASKHAVIGLTRSAALDCARRGVRINAICPGGTRTPMQSAALEGHPEIFEAGLAAHPMHRYSEPQEQAAAILFLASKDASFMTGQAVAVDGGYTVQ